jgi:uncharacterized protein
MSLISADLLELLRHEFCLDWTGLHGINHWKRVRENGLRLADSTGADTNIIELFAFLHDLKRENDGWDHGHGERAAQFISVNRHILPTVSSTDFDILVYVIQHHSSGITEGDINAQTCWDADRLDLGRIGVMPDARYLCTEAAKEADIIQWAYDRSRGY